MALIAIWSYLTAPVALGQPARLAEDPCVAEFQLLLAEQTVLQPDAPPELLLDVVGGLSTVDYQGLTPGGTAKLLGEAFARYLVIDGTAHADIVQSRIVRSLFRMSGERAVPFLATKLLDPSPRTRGKAGHLLALTVGVVCEDDSRAREVETAVQAPLAIMQTYDMDVVVSRMALAAVSGMASGYVMAGRVPPDRLIQAVARMCGNADEMADYQAAKALHSLGRDDLVPADLMEKLRADPEIHETWDQQADEQ